MAKIENKWIEDGAVDDTKIKLQNDGSLLARNFADSADVAILKINVSDRIEFASLPQVTSDPVAANDLGRKSYIDATADAKVADTIVDAATTVAPSQNAVFDALALKINLTEKAANNGVATLDAGGKIPAAQLPNSLMDYQGNWAASTNTPALADGVGSSGDIYKATDAGTVDFGAGNISFVAGDWAVYNGTIWENSINSDAVNSVNGQLGVVVLGTDEISEGATNLYFTNTRAQTAAVVNSTAGSETVQAASVASMKTYVGTIADAKVSDAVYGAGWNADVTVAPSKNAVYDQLEVMIAANAAKVAKAGDSMDSAANLTFSGGGEVLGLPATPSATAATSKEYVDAQIIASAGSTNGREVLTLIAGDITNGYVEIAQPALANSISVQPVGGPPQEPGVDYTESIVVTNTRITFAGDLLALLVAGNKLIISYEY